MVRIAGGTCTAVLDIVGPWALPDQGAASCRPRWLFSWAASFWALLIIQRACGHATDPCNRPWAHKGTIGNPPRGPGGPPGIFGFGGNPCKTFPWEGLGGNGHTQRLPGYHTNHSPRKKSWETSWGTNPSTKLCFWGPLFGPQKGPGPPRAYLWGWGLQK